MITASIPVVSAAQLASTAEHPGDKLTRRQRIVYILILGALTALGPFTIDLYLPAFPTLESEFGVLPSVIQLTLTGTMIGFGLGQLVVGPWSDKVGRRLPLMLATGVHILACVGAALSNEIVVLHGAGVDHREPEACFEPVFDGVAGFRRIYPGLPGMGRTVASDELCSAEGVLGTLLEFAQEVTGGTAHLLIGHSAGAYYARTMAARAPRQVAGLALICPLLSSVRDVPEHCVVAGSGDLGDDAFRSYFVVQTPQMLERYERYIAPFAALVDQAALERIGQRWELAPDPGPAYAGPTLVVAGRLDSVVGYAAAADFLDQYPHASLAVVDHAGHALPHEQPDLLRALVTDWLARVEPHAR